MAMLLCTLVPVCVQVTCAAGIPFMGLIFEQVVLSD